jgi:hypothetical protein
MSRNKSPQINNNSGNGGGGNMTELEKRVCSIEVDIAVIKSNYATKTDISDLRTEVSKEIHTQTRWIIATIITAMGLLFAAQRVFPTQSPQPTQQISTNQSK